MNDESSSIKKKLRLGIEAAQTGKKNIARVHLTAVLNLEPENIPAMLWLAYVSPSPQETIHLLERVLALDPDNERARAGIRWARGRLSQETIEPDAGDTRQIPAEVQTQPVAPAEIQSQPATETETESQAAESADDESLRQKLLSDDAQKQAKKGALAHRARRTIDPIATILLVVGTLLGLVALGLGALIFVPRDTLAAWLPASTPAAVVSPPLETYPTVAEAPPPFTEVSSTPPANDFASDTDTIIPPLLIEPKTVEPDSAALPVQVELELTPEIVAPLPLAETNLAAIEPATLLGPAPPQTEPEATPAVDNLSLAHQPAYPGEKWIEVNVTTQQITAYEGETPVFSFTGSTGLTYTPTVLGEFHIYWKLESTLMSGPGYYLPGVPYTMYFYRGYSLHGTYWHNNFGTPMSHGCVNLKTDDAKKLFEWADPVMPPGQTQVVATAENPGTLVVVRE
jgi:lipoprotein-anchoring transpeptidase ErfK/SrfK